MPKEFKKYVMTFEAYQAMEQQMLAEASQVDPIHEGLREIITAIKTKKPGLSDMASMLMSDDKVQGRLAQMETEAGKLPEDDEKKFVLELIAKAKSGDKQALNDLKPAAIFFATNYGGGQTTGTTQAIGAQQAAQSRELLAAGSKAAPKV